MAHGSPCTDFCEKLKQLHVEGEKLPTYEELVSELSFSANDKIHGRRLGTIQDLKRRTQCAFCQLALDAASRSTIGNYRSPIDGLQTIDVLLFPEEQSFRLSLPSRLGTKLTFVADNDAQISGPDNARPVSGSQIESSQILRWLRKCEEHHGSACAGHSGTEIPRTKYDFNESATSNFRVIDLKLGCVRRVPLGSRYVALSYVWGQLPMAKLLKDNLSHFTHNGALDAMRPNLPRTVNDAIDMVRSLNENFLWIDALCLVQDDPHDVQLGIEMMNSIYQGSYFTIIAGSGEDAGSGIPGVSQGSRSILEKTRELTPGLKMTILHSIDWHLRRSTYGSRGWTLQELVLPRRAIIFVNSQVYYRCQEANWSEESTADSWPNWLDADDSNISRIPDKTEGIIASFWAFQKLCEDYSKRALRFDGDALRAMAGILRPVAAGMQTVMIEGLPAAYLDIGLLFISSQSNLKRRKQFPSFSWAGWSGQIMWTRENYNWFEDGKMSWDAPNLSKWLDHKTFIEWTLWKPSNEIAHISFEPYDQPTRLTILLESLPRVFSRPTIDTLKSFNTPLGCGVSGSSGFYNRMDKTRPSRKQWVTHSDLELVNGETEFHKLANQIGSVPERLMMMNWIAQRNGLVRRGKASLSHSQTIEDSPQSLADETEADNYRFRELIASDRRPEDQRTKDVKKAVAEKQSRSDGGGSTADSVPAFPPYAVLRFRTISIHVLLAQPVQRTLKAPIEVSAADRIPGISLLSSSDQVVGSLHPDNFDMLPSSPDAKIECLLFSRCQVPTIGSVLLDPTLTPPKLPIDRPPTGQPWDLFWVMYIVWNPETKGVAERRGIGQVLAASVFDLGDRLPAPEIKTVLLG